ncbi:hypothetical protein [Spirosoma sp. KNUC1025]|uniref:putative polyvalent protein kinase domain-containing protein n=1 Tax=Spirosoma sp. KNUC1025 TaxID=2894082 RepID=UPI00386F4F1A|nr:hypothetical protein LN737_26405 [Spirosoma sp. KNUC1025]
MLSQGYEQRSYRPERLPQAAEQTPGEGSLRAALALTRGVHETATAIGYQEPQTSDERWELYQIIRPQETVALKNWADTSNLWLNEADFTKNWFSFGEIEGGEHQLYQQNGYFIKRNNLLYHTNWLEYFHRLVLHNWLFPETAVHFEGLMLVGDELQPVIRQKALLAIRGADRKEVETEMAKRGFYRRKADNYYNPDLGILVEDLHDENVLVSPRGSLLIFDPVIYLAKPEMGLPTPPGFY